MTQSKRKTVRPFIGPASRPDTLQELADAPIQSLERRIAYIIEQATSARPDAKKDGKDGAVESPLTFGDAYLQLDEARIKNDKLQSEKWRESTGKTEGSESKEQCEQRSIAIIGGAGTIDEKSIKEVEEFNVSRFGIKLKGKAAII